MEAVKYEFESYHLVWLQVHPGRTPSWLKERLRDGFHIHHVDGDHSNDEPSNLVLIEAVDHMRLHGMKLKDGIKRWRSKPRLVKADPEDKPEKPSDGDRVYQMKAELGCSWTEVAQIYHSGVKPRDVAWSDIGSTMSNRARKFASANARPWPPTNLE